MAWSGAPNRRFCRSHIASHTAPHQLDHPLPDRTEIGTHADEHLSGHSFALTYEAQQDVLGADEAVAELERLTQRSRSKWNSTMPASGSGLSRD